MDLRVKQPHRNGTYEAPRVVRGASPASPPPRREATTFPEEVPTHGGQALLYALHRFQIGGVSLMRLLMTALLFVSALWLTNTLPGGRWGSLPWLLAALALVLAGRTGRKSAYLSFHEQPPPQLTAARLLSEDKVAVYATGLFTVEGKYQRFTWLPGFYRTFATREHALLCLARERRWLFFARWPAGEPGMWYAFIAPATITRIRWGELHFGANHAPGLAIDYQLTMPSDSRRKHDQVRAETLYLAFAMPEDAETVLADLLADDAPGAGSRGIAGADRL